MSLEPICSNIYNSRNLQRIVHCFIFFSENREKTLSTYSDIIKFRLKCGVFLHIKSQIYFHLYGFYGYIFLQCWKSFSCASYVNCFKYNINTVMDRLRLYNLSLFCVMELIWGFLDLVCSFLFLASFSFWMIAIIVLIKPLQLCLISLLSWDVCSASWARNVS